MYGQNLSMELKCFFLLRLHSCFLSFHFSILTTVVMLFLRFVGVSFLPLIRYCMFVKDIASFFSILLFVLFLINKEITF